MLINHVLTEGNVIRSTDYVKAMAIDPEGLDAAIRREATRHGERGDALRILAAPMVARRIAGGEGKGKAMAAYSCFPSGSAGWANHIVSLGRLVTVIGLPADGALVRDWAMTKRMGKAAFKPAIAYIMSSDGASFDRDHFAALVAAGDAGKPVDSTVATTSGGAAGDGEGSDGGAPIGEPVADTLTIESLLRMIADIPAITAAHDFDRATVAAAMATALDLIAPTASQPIVIAA